MGGAKAALPSCSATSRRASLFTYDAAFARWPTEGVGTQGFVFGHGPSCASGAGRTQGLGPAFQVSAVGVTVMQVWEVRVAMNHRGVTMRMRVRFANGVVRRMVMLMVIVMAV